MAIPQQKLAQLDVISLLSDTDDEDDEAAEPAPLGEYSHSDLASSPVQITTPSAFWDWPADIDEPAAQTYGGYREAGDELFFIADDGSGAGPSVITPAHASRTLPGPTPALKEVLNAKECLQRILDIFPDVSHEHVYSLYDAFDGAADYEPLPASARLENMLEQLVSANSYPKEPRKDKGKKRKRDDSPEAGSWRRWLRADRPSAPDFTKPYVYDILKQEFSGVRFDHTPIHRVVVNERHLFQAYVEMAKTQDRHSLQPGRRDGAFNAVAEAIAAACGWPALLDELHDARRYVAYMREEEYMQDAIKRREEENLRIATAAGDTAECQSCFDTYAVNRQIHCDGPEAHFTCFECAETYIKTQIGQSACVVVCTAGCGASFSPQQLNLLSNKELLAKFAELEQQKAIRDAGLEDLEECCFCEYKAIMPSIDQNFLFECANPDCGKVSCRRCRKEAHTPLSCAEVANDNKLSSRHKIEEAMTAALIRSCNKCKKQFIKEYGCNKMTCSSCGNVQCYLCSQDVRSYDHFDAGAVRRSSSSCRLHDDVEERHAREIKEAELSARAQVLKENPHISEQDLEIKTIESASQQSRKSAQLRMLELRRAQMVALDQRALALAQSAADRRLIVPGNPGAQRHQDRQDVWHRRYGVINAQAHPGLPASDDPVLAAAAAARAAHRARVLPLPQNHDRHANHRGVAPRG